MKRNVYDYKFNILFEIDTSDNDLTNELQNKLIELNWIKSDDSLTWRNLENKNQNNNPMIHIYTIRNLS